MSAFLQVFSDQELAIKACGRVCADMHPLSLPAVPVPPPLSLSAIMREHPEIELQPEWLEAMETDPTLH
jgi:hypothetical protein